MKPYGGIRIVKVAQGEQLEETMLASIKMTKDVYFLWKMYLLPKLSVMPNNLFFLLENYFFKWKIGDDGVSCNGTFGDFLLHLVTS